MMRSDDRRQQIRQERLGVLRQLEDWLEAPMLVLGFTWLALLILELTRGLSPLLQDVTLIIWGTFILDFTLKLTIAPDKSDFLKRNWLTVISLVVPALRLFRAVRVLRVLRLARASRGLRLLKIFASLNRGMQALRTSLKRRGFGYVLALTVIVTLAGAAGMYAFESPHAGEKGIDSYGSALWWTAMVMTTLGSEYWPASPEGRILCFFLSLYALAVFGYITATVATFFIDRDAEDRSSGIAGESPLGEMRAQLSRIEARLERLARIEDENKYNHPKT